MTNTATASACTNPVVRTYLVCEALTVREVRLTVLGKLGTECDVFGGFVIPGSKPCTGGAS